MLGQLEADHPSVPSNEEALLDLMSRLGRKARSPTIFRQ